jgi:hypothetical protein
MKRQFVSLMIFALLSSTIIFSTFVLPVSAEEPNVNPGGIPAQPPQIEMPKGLPTPTCPILTIDMGLTENQGVLDKLDIPYTTVTPSQFLTTDLSLYKVLYIGWDYLADPAAFTALNARKSDIASWVSNGGVIVALAEYAHGFSWLPLPVSIKTVMREDVVITDPSHPIMTGLSNSLLSNWINSYHCYFTSWDPAYKILANSSYYKLPVTLQAYYGRGAIVITGQDADYHYYYRSEPGAGLLLNNMLSWACSYEGPVGGEIVSASPMAILTQAAIAYWFIPAIAIIAATTLYVRKRRK